MMTVICGTAVLLLIWFKCIGCIECTWFVTILPLIVGVLIDIFGLGFLYWYHEIRGKEKE